ncbi:MAG: heparan-alpha-glucosaminide N-acetyltransferase domain-containing protein [Ferruginibacter sp.]
MDTLTVNRSRIRSIDFLRGLIMVIMALDHTRDFFHKDGLIGDPLNPDTTSPILYFTRWITHFCAPTFVFLSGLSAWLQSKRKSKKELSLFLITRGLWLIAVDLIIMSFAFTLDIHYGNFVLETLWSIGAGMAILGLIIYLPFNMILALGLVILFGHNLLDYAEASRAGKVPLWWNFLHLVTIAKLWGDHSLFIFYPFLSWSGLMMLGYCCGKLFTDVQPQQRNKILRWTGACAILVFITLRLINGYGNPQHWSEQKDALKTFFSFMNVQKYPPSLLFLCATMGPMLIFLSLLKEAGNRISKIISVYGRVPLFYFIVHFLVLHLAQAITYLARGHSFEEGMQGLPGLPFKFAAPGEGYNLFIVYCIWILTVIIMYPFCKWYDNYKINHKEKWWLSYL